MKPEFDVNLEDYIDNDVVDVNDSPVGTLACVWYNQNGETAFLGIRSGSSPHKTHVVPARRGIHVNDRAAIVHVPFAGEVIGAAPCFDADSDLDDATERKVYAYYRVKPLKHAMA